MRLHRCRSDEELFDMLRSYMDWFSARLRTALLYGQRRTTVLLPNGQRTAFFIDQHDLEECLELTRQNASSMLAEF